MVECSWDPVKHDGKPCPHHHVSIRGGKYYFGTEEIDKDTYIELRKTHAHKEFDADEPKTLENLPRLQKQLTVEEASESTNPNYTEYMTKDKGRQNNCQKCCAIFELRCRGYDVTAAPWNPCYVVKNGEYVHSDTNKPGLRDVFDRHEFTEILPTSYRYYSSGHAALDDRDKALKMYNENLGKHEDVKVYNQDCYRLLSKGPKKVIEENISKFPNSRWVVSVDWSDTIGFQKKYRNGGHVFIATVNEKGKVKFLEPQSNKVVTNDSHWKYLAYKSYSSTEFYRIDNRDFKEEALETFIYDRSKTDDEY